MKSKGQKSRLIKREAAAEYKFGLLAAICKGACKKRVLPRRVNV